MPRRTPPSPARRASRFAPAIEGLESRVVLSAAAGPVGSLLRQARLAGPPAAQASTPDVTTFPLKMKSFTGLFQGSYTVGPSRSPGFDTQLYMTSPGTTSQFLKGYIQLALQVPTDKAYPAVGLANVNPWSASDSGDTLVLDLQAVPGAVDQAGRPTEFTWTASDSSSGQFSGGEGSGTLHLMYYPGRKVPRGAVAAGRLGVVIRGTVGINPVGSLFP